MTANSTTQGKTARHAKQHLIKQSENIKRPRNNRQIKITMQTLKQLLKYACMLKYLKENMNKLKNKWNT